MAELSDAGSKGVKYLGLPSLVQIGALALLLSACATPPPAPVVDRSIDSRSQTRSAARPNSYSVRRGDTLYAIAWRYGLDYKQLARWNSIPAPYTIYPRQNLRLSAPPVSSSTVSVRPATSRAPVRTSPASSGTASAPSQKPSTSRPPATTSGTSTSATPSNKPPASTPVASQPTTSSKPASVGSAVGGRGQIGFAWPTDGGVLSSFASNDPTRNGIDISGKSGQRVNAAAAGQVVYSGTGLVGYGELIIVKHNDEWLSAYGHNRKRLVSEGDMVKSGQQIAEFGDSGTNRPKLHFEIRKNGKPVDPLRYLPKK